MGNKNNAPKRTKTKIKPKFEDDFYLEGYEIINNNSNKNFRKRYSQIIRFDSNMLIQNINQDPLKIYHKEKLLGKGTFGEVYLVKHYITGIIRAMKVIDKKNIELEGEELSDEEILNEINILKKIDHPNIMKIFEFYKTITTYYLILEFCEGGNLYDFVYENHLSEFQVI